jgi:hypothetical protein
MRLAFERKSGRGDRITDPLAETVNCERLPTLSINYCEMIALVDTENLKQVAV